MSILLGNEQNKRVNIIVFLLALCINLFTKPYVTQDSRPCQGLGRWARTTQEIQHYIANNIDYY